MTEATQHTATDAAPETAPPRALEGFRVLEDGGGIAAAYAGKLLADLGADLIKIEPPAGGDPIRRRGPFPADRPHRELGGLHLFLDTNKRSVALDLQTAAGRRLFRQLAATSEAVITTRPISEQRALGLSWDDLAAANPNLVTVSITTFGVGTRRQDWQASSLTTSMASGISYRIGDPDKAPLGLPYDAPLYQGGIHGAIAALLGRRAARQNGTQDGGQHIWLSIVDIVGSVMAGAGVAAYVFTGQSRGRAGVRMNAFYPWQVTPVKDGYFEVITMVDDQWNRFLDLLGSPEWRNDERLENRWLAFQHADALDALWHPWMRERTKSELWKQFSDNRISFQPVHTIAEVAESNHLKARNFWTATEHPNTPNTTRPSAPNAPRPITPDTNPQSALDANAQTTPTAIPLPGAPYKLSTTPWQIRRPPPQLGQHTAELLQETTTTAPAKLRRANLT